MSDTSPPLKPILWVIGFFGGWDLLMWLWIRSSDYYSHTGQTIAWSLTVSTVIAQFSLFAIGSVLGPGTWAKRLMVSFGTALFWFVCWHIGYGAVIQREAEFFSPYFLRLVAILFLMLPAICLAVQAPLWIARSARGWRIVAGAEADAKRSMTTRDIFSGTGFVALAISCVKLAHVLQHYWRNGPEAESLRRAMENTYWLQIVFYGLVLFGASLAIVLPFATVILRGNSLESRIFKLAMYVFFLLLLYPTCVLIFGGRIDMQGVVAWLGIVGLSTMTLAGPLIYLRGHGYRLLWRDETY